MSCQTEAAPAGRPACHGHLGKAVKERLRLVFSKLMYAVMLSYSRVPTQILCFNSLFFPCLTANFSCANFSDFLMFHMQNRIGRQIQFLRKDWEIPRQIAQYPYFPLQGFFVDIFHIFSRDPVEIVTCGFVTSARGGRGLVFKTFSLCN